MPIEEIQGVEACGLYKQTTTIAGDVGPKLDQTLGHACLALPAKYD